MLGWRSATRSTRTGQAGRDELLERVAGATALVADPTVPVDGELLDAAGATLRVVANFAVGYDNVDVAACRERGVVVTNTPDVLTNATAELAVALMLAAARRLGEAERLVRAGRWTGWEPSQLLGPGAERRGGRNRGTGAHRHARRRAAARVRRRHCCTRRARAIPRRSAASESSMRSLEELLERSDFVTLHVPLSPQTHHLIDAHALARMKPGADPREHLPRRAGGLRGAGRARCATERLGGAGLDVYEQEPKVPPELIELERVVLAPHIGSATAAARDGMAQLVAENVIAVLEGRAPLTPVEPG